MLAILMSLDKQYMGLTGEGGAKKRQTISQIASSGFGKKQWMWASRGSAKPLNKQRQEEK